MSLIGNLEKPKVNSQFWRVIGKRYEVPFQEVTNVLILIITSWFWRGKGVLFNLQEKFVVLAS